MKAYICDCCGCGACIIFDTATNAVEIPSHCAYHDVSDWKEIDHAEALKAIHEAEAI